MVDQLKNVGDQDLSYMEQDAFTLSEAALQIDNARSAKDHAELATALDRNLELWIGIRTLICRADSQIHGSVRENLVKLADYVTRTTLDKGVEMAPTTIESLININLQISEGLLEGHSRH